MGDIANGVANTLLPAQKNIQKKIFIACILDITPASILDITPASIQGLTSVCMSDIVPACSFYFVEVKCLSSSHSCVFPACVPGIVPAYFLAIANVYSLGICSSCVVSQVQFVPLCQKISC